MVRDDSALCPEALRRDLEAHLLHRFFEEQAILSQAERLDARPQKLDPELELEV